MTRIAFIPLHPLGDSILLMGQLEELKRLYEPCEITVFAIPIVAELYANFMPCDRAIALRGEVHGSVSLPVGFNETFDIVFNHGYEPWYDGIVRKLKRSDGKAYGMEENYRSAAVCEDLFDKWVPLEYWNRVTKTQWPLAVNEMAELVRLVNPNFSGGPVRLTTGNYRCVRPENAPEGDFVLFLPGTSAPDKIYPMHKIAALASAVRDIGVGTIFALGPQDGETKDRLRKNGFEFFADLPLSNLAWLIANARLVIGNDSGPMHLAASFDVPSIHFFSHSGADNWFCYDTERHRLLMPNCGIRHGRVCGECERACIGKVSVAAALSEACNLLNVEMPRIGSVAFFPQDLIGDALVWANQIDAFMKLFSPCEVAVFCTKGVAELFGGMAFCDRVVEYDPEKPWSEDEVRGFGHFDLVVNTRYDADSAARVEALDHDEACGFENVDIPEAVCKCIYDRYMPLSRWDDFHLRRETSVTEQGAELVRLYDPDYHCEFVELGKTDFVREAPEPSDAPRIVLVLGASDPAKSWGLENYIGVARSLKGRGFRPLFLLGPGERALAPRVAEAGFEAGVCLPFRKIAGLFDPDYGTACVVGNDTGLMHLACMLGAPSVTIMPHGHHFTWFPYAADERARHVCLAPACATPMCVSECGETAKCAGKIQVEQVLDGIEEVTK